MNRSISARRHKKIHIRLRVCFFVLICVGLALPPFLPAADKLRVATGGYSPSVPPYFTFAAPFLRRQDIEIEDILMSSGSLSAQALASGAVKVVLTTGAVALQANIAGGEMVIIAGTVNRLPYQIVGRGDIKSPALLKGKRVAISRFGSSSEWLLRLGLAKLGVDPDKDVTLIQIGGQSDRLAALNSNAVQATLLAPPISTNAVKKLGMKELVDMSELDVAYPLQAVITTRGFLQENRPLLKRFLKGLGAALHQYKNGPQAGANFQIKQFRLVPEDAEAGYGASSRVTDFDLRIPGRPALELAFKEIAARVEKARKMGVADLHVVDESLRNELVHERFFEQLGR